MVYPVGSNVIIYNTETKAQRFIAVAEKADVITAMCLSQTKKFLAVGLRSEKAASVVIYDIASMRKRKTLVLADVESKVGCVWAGSVVQPPAIMAPCDDPTGGCVSGL